MVSLTFFISAESKFCLRYHRRDQDVQKVRKCQIQEGGKVDENSADTLGWKSPSKSLHQRLFIFLALLALAKKKPESVEKLFGRVEPIGHVQLRSLRTLQPFWHQAKRTPRPYDSIRRDIINHFDTEILIELKADRLSPIENQSFSLRLNEAEISFEDNADEKLLDRIRKDISPAQALGSLHFDSTVDQSAAPIEQHDQALVSSYRERNKGRFARLDLGVFHLARGLQRQDFAEFQLDELYIPLRFKSEQTNFPEESTIDHSRLLSLHQALLIRGAGGSGKTTWMRWTFRRLLELHNVLPIFIEVRQVAREWSRSKDPALRNLDKCIESEINRWSGSDGTNTLVPVFRGNRWRSILLLDGWDELGEEGEELRAQLSGFMKNLPHILVIVTSRPYGSGQPSQVENFEVMDILPLRDNDIRALVDRFFGAIQKRGLESTQNSEQFYRNLDRASGARDLARSPLFLMMMLAMGSANSLPIKRYRLYQNCLRNLLSTLPNQRQEAGALLGFGQWRPDTHDERMNAVSGMAFSIHDAAFSKKVTGSIVGNWEFLATLLPKQWSENQRYGFLAWLSGPAGLLSDRTDGTAVFSHLTLQEFLVAWYLFRTIKDSPERVDFVLTRATANHWWESLRLWSALISEDYVSVLSSFITTLCNQDDSRYWLAGVLLADGLGDQTHLSFWIEKMPHHFGFAEWTPALTCARAVAVSKNEPMREAISSFMSQVAFSRVWINILWLQNWIRVAELNINIPPPSEHFTGVTLASLSQNFDLDNLHQDSVALSRVFTGTGPYWPEIPELTLLRTWPSERLEIGYRLQTLASMGATRSQIINFAKSSLGCPTDLEISLSNHSYSLGGTWISVYVKHLSRLFGRDLLPYLGEQFSRYCVINFIENASAYFNNMLADDLRSYFGISRKLDPAFAINFARRYLGNCATYCTQEWIAELTTRLSDESFDFPEFVLLEMINVGRMGTWKALGEFASRTSCHLAWSLISAACHIRAHATMDYQLLHTELKRWDSSNDPLWPALAKHLVGQSSQKDRTLLGELAAHPEKRAGILQWGLRYYIRGDVLLASGETLLLDDITGILGIHPLPYLD